MSSTLSPTSPALESSEDAALHSASSPSRRAMPYRISSYEKPPSRTTSTVFPLFHSSLSYALVRDFAYPPFNPLHYGPIEDFHSGDTTPTQDYDGGSRRVSDPPPGAAPTGPWRDSSFDANGQQLPSTSFDDSDDEYSTSQRASRRISKHRKSRSYADMNDYTRSRRKSGRAQPYFSGVGGGGGKNGEPQTPRLGTGGARASAAGYADLTLDPTQPPFREDTDSVPYSPSALEEHRPESASLDESFAGPSLALYDFAPENDNELELKEGQIIQVGYRHGQGWLVAMNLETGEQGLVPEEYVRLLRDIEGWEAAIGPGGGADAVESDNTAPRDDVVSGEGAAAVQTP